MFDWLLYIDGKLEEKYLNQKLSEENKFSIRKNMYLKYSLMECYLIKNEDDYNLKLDFNKRVGTIILKENNVITNFDLLDVKISQNKNKIFIEYRIDDSMNKIIINRKDKSYD